MSQTIIQSGLMNVSNYLFESPIADFDSICSLQSTLVKGPSSSTKMEGGKNSYSDGDEMDSSLLSTTDTKLDGSAFLGQNSWQIWPYMLRRKENGYVGLFIYDGEECIPQS
jgi:hypothetical protein